MLPIGTADAINQVGDYADRILYKSAPAYGEQENKDGQNTGVSISTPEDIQELWRSRTRHYSKTGECSFKMRMMKIKTVALSGVLFISQQKGKIPIPNWRFIFMLRCEPGHWWDCFQFLTARKAPLHALGFAHQFDSAETHKPELHTANTDITVLAPPFT